MGSWGKGRFIFELLSDYPGRAVTRGASIIDLLGYLVHRRSQIVSRCRLFPSMRLRLQRVTGGTAADNYDGPAQPSSEPPVVPPSQKTVPRHTSLTSLGCDESVVQKRK